MTFDELKGRLDALDAKVDALTESVLGLQHNSLRLLGAGSLLGGVLIFVLSRAAGL